MLKEFNNLMDYIETHLTEEISGKDISKIVGVSDYHFKRMFSYMAGMSLSEYIKNRRLSVANDELIKGAKVTDVAYKYCYQSLEGFSRAFREWSGFLPSDVAHNNIQKSFPKFSFHLEIKGGISVEFKIEKKEKFNIVGVFTRVPRQPEEIKNAVTELAKSITEQQRNEMSQLGDLYPHQILQVGFHFDEDSLEEKDYFSYMMGFATTKENTFDDLKQISVEESLWAIFPNQGAFPATLQETNAKIFTEWYLVYDAEYSSLFKRKIPVGIIYTMGLNETMMKEMGYEQILGRTELSLGRIFGYTETLYVTDTYQFSDYSKYVAPKFNEEEKAKRRNEEFPKDCQKAFEMGVRFVQYKQEN